MSELIKSAMRHLSLLLDGQPITGDIAVLTKEDCVAEKALRRIIELENVNVLLKQKEENLKSLLEKTIAKIDQLRVYMLKELIELRPTKDTEWINANAIISTIEMMNDD
jgi:hypothetical protein